MHKITSLTDLPIEIIEQIVGKFQLCIGSSLIVALGQHASVAEVLIPHCSKMPRERPRTTRG